MHIIELPPDLEAGSHRIENTAVFQSLAPLEGFRGYSLGASAVYLMQPLLTGYLLAAGPARPYYPPPGIR